MPSKNRYIGELPKIGIRPTIDFRPSASNCFGTVDLEGADFRACANFGPLYG